MHYPIDTFEERFKWQSAYTGQVFDILRVYLPGMLTALDLLTIKIAPLEDDLNKATDALITVHANLAICQRLRTVESCIGKDGTIYRDLTLRAKLASGKRTELPKVRDDGFGNFYFYAWLLAQRITEWALVDLDKTRESGLLHKDYRLIPNKGYRDSEFVGIPMADLSRAGCLVHHTITAVRIPEPTTQETQQKQLSLL